MTTPDTTSAKKVSTTKLGVLKKEIIEFLEKKDLKQHTNKFGEVFDEIPEHIGHIHDLNVVLQELEKKYGVGQVNTWVSYPVEPAIPNPQNRLWYAWFCYGYLYFWDFQVRSGQNPHAIYLHWTKGMVTIFITPPKNDHDGSKECFVPQPPAVSDPPPPPPPPPPPMG